MKILSYNLEYGGRSNGDPRGRWDLLCEVIRQVQPDVAILLEAWGWHAHDLETFAAQAGLSHGYLSRSNTDHHLAVASRVEPITKQVQRVGFHHSLLAAEFRDLTIFGAHLSPKTEDARLAELGYLIPQIEQARNPVLLGDLNSLSPSDEYDRQEVLEQLAGAGIKKFGNGRLETKVIAKLLDSGLCDAYQHLHSEEAVGYSVPTASCTDAEHAVKLRLDYCFVRPYMLPRVRHAEIIRNELTDLASDHYPLVVEIK